MNRTPSLLALITLLLFCAAPTPGDIGGCGQEAVELDAEQFFGIKAGIDCDRCRECGIDSESCQTACSGSEIAGQDFPSDCLPLVHDGEVCLRALSQAACGDYVEYMSDAAPRVPTECDFCPGGGR